MYIFILLLKAFPKYLIASISGMKVPYLVQPISYTATIIIILGHLIVPFPLLNSSLHIFIHSFISFHLEYLVLALSS